MGRTQLLLGFGGIVFVACLVGSGSAATDRVEERSSAKLDEVPAKLHGTFVVTTTMESAGMIALVDPEFQTIEGKLFFVGVVSEKNGFVRDTPFTGGVSYLPVKRIGAIQELKIED